MMREGQDSTATAGAAPTVNGVLVSIFVPDDHPLLRLKAALDWARIKAVMVKHWAAAGKNVSGGRGLAWPVDLYVSLLVLMWIETLHSRQMEKYLGESVVGRRFLDLPTQQAMHIRDHASIARRSGSGCRGQSRSQCSDHQNSSGIGYHQR